MTYMHHFILILAVTLLRKCYMRVEETPVAIVRVRVEKGLNANSIHCLLQRPLPGEQRKGGEGLGGEVGDLRFDESLEL